METKEKGGREKWDKYIYIDGLTTRKGERRERKKERERERERER